MIAKATTDSLGGNKSTPQIVRKVTLTGICDIMFDRYAGDNKTTLTPEQKLYYGPRGELVLPSVNIMSFLSAQNTTSAPKRLMDQRSYKAVCQACLGYVVIEPMLIPFARCGEPIGFSGFDNGDGDPGLIYIHRSVARLPKGIPNAKVRPVLACPWELTFQLTLYRTPELPETQLYNLFVDGGLAIGLGTFRGVFGKFSVTTWE